MKGKSVSPSTTTARPLSPQVALAIGTRVRVVFAAEPVGSVADHWFELSSPETGRPVDDDR